MRLLRIGRIRNAKVYLGDASRVMNTFHVGVAIVCVAIVILQNVLEQIGNFPSTLNVLHTLLVQSAIEGFYCSKLEFL